MPASPEFAALLNVLLAAVVSSATALATIFFTASLARRREHEADWRKLKLAQYQEFILALSGVAIGRDITPEVHRRYADAVNAMGLVAPPDVLRALNAFVTENALGNPGRTEAGVIARTDELVRAMRRDVYPAGAGSRDHVEFRLLAPSRP